MTWRVIETYHSKEGFVSENPVVDFDHPTDAKKYAEWLNSLKVTGIVSGLVYNVKRKQELPWNLSPGKHYAANLLETKEKQNGTELPKSGNRDERKLQD